MKMLTKSLLGALVVVFASACFAARPLPENPGLTDARKPAARPRGEELSLFALEERIRETPALTSLRKDALMAEIDALVVRFRAAHAEGSPRVSALRQPYESLMARMQAMLKQDPQLASDVAASRGPIWDVLADRAHFASLEQ
jgi:hypothetical protein